MNNSTLAMVTKTLTRWNRLALLHTKTALWCKTHQQVERVLDRFPNGECKLSCGCRRATFNRSDDEIAAYEVAKRECGKRRRAKGSQNSTKHFAVVYEEDLEEEAVA